jgi:Fic family protein
MSRITEPEGTERGHEEPISWSGKRVNAWVPFPLGGQDFDVAIRTARRTEQAIAAVRAAGTQPARFLPLGMLLLRAEGVASSFIESLRVPLVDVAAAEVGGTTDVTALAVADNLGAVVDALRSPLLPLQVEDLHHWHRRLMAASSIPDEMIGAFRKEQSWIGGTSPRDAALVPPPPDRIERLMADLIEFVNGKGTDPVTQAAVAHAQFETIHPYGDGNGRIGRVLIGWILARRLGITVPPPVSVFIARDPGGYLAGLTMFRLGQLDPWVDWLAGALLRTSEAVQDLVAGAERLVGVWGERLHDVRRGATARQIIELLGQSPVVSSDLVAGRLGVSERSARTALHALADRGILQPYGRSASGAGRPRHFWVAAELLQLISGWPGIT